MEQRETFFQFLIRRLGKCAHASVGLFIFAIGTYFQIQANFGMAPWNALNQGLSMNFPITYGQASILVSAIIILVDLIMREPIGLGTIISVVCSGAVMDLVFKIVKFNPKTVKHEGLPETIAAMMRSLKK